MNDYNNFPDGVWHVDFEFGVDENLLPVPKALTAIEQVSGETIQLRGPELTKLGAAPWPTGPGAITVAYFASAEMSCVLKLGWDLPVNVLDLYAEFRVLTNGQPLPAGNGLLGAMAAFGLPLMVSEGEKDLMRQLALVDREYSEAEWLALLDYNASDVRATLELERKLRPHLNLDHALLRGEYMKSVARMERNGIPLDSELLHKLETQWPALIAHLIAMTDKEFNLRGQTQCVGIFQSGSFKANRWLAWCAQEGIDWPVLPSGAPDLKNETFKLMEHRDPRIAKMRQLRKTLGEVRASDLPVGKDGRNRVLFSPFGTKTGRNAPSTTKFIFGRSAWMRSLIKPGSGKALGYIDWSQQEIGEAAALSDDKAMQQAYLSGDFYMNFAILAGAAPQGATKKTHPDARKKYKACALGVQYAMGAENMGAQLGITTVEANLLLENHRKVFASFWKWNAEAINHAQLTGSITSTFGWTLHVTAETKIRTLGNFPMQANGAEMLRLAIIRMHQLGVSVCAPIHDAVLIEAPINEIDAAVAKAQAAMAWASRQVLAGFELRSDVYIIRSPERYVDEDRGAETWAMAMGFLEEAP